MTFIDVVRHCLDNVSLVNEFNRLNKNKLGVDKRSAIAKMIDEACEHDPHDEAITDFLNFVYKTVWLPMESQFLKKERKFLLLDASGVQAPEAVDSRAVIPQP